MIFFIYVYLVNYQFLGLFLVKTKKKLIQFPFLILIMYYIFYCNENILILYYKKQNILKLLFIL